MRKQSLISGILFLALFVSAWGHVLAAVLCPHMTPDHSCCHAQLPHRSESHEMMDGMQMSEMETMPAVDPQTEADALSQPSMSCEYCISHSGQLPTLINIREASQVERRADVSAPLAPSTLISLAPTLPSIIPSRQHAPPGDGSPRHMLISIFRI